jgi:hypothetical protein
VTDDADRIVRPNFVQWLRYVYLGSVPAKNSAWVLHDATTGTWWVRHIVRYVVSLLPIVVLIIVLLPGELPIRIGVALVGLVGTALLTFGYMVDSTERKVEKAGFEYGIAAKMRQRKSVDNQSIVAERNRARRIAREQRRRAL